MTKKKYPAFDAQKHSHQDKNPLTVEEAKALIGWQVADDKDYIFRDLDGNKIKLENNPDNRPFRMVLAKRYANEMIRGKWDGLNGETIIFDWFGFCQSGQHRLVAFILADQMREQGLKTVWSKEASLECLIVLGTDPSSADTLDMGQKRSLGDVLFRRVDFSGKSKSEQKKLTNILSHTIRMVWLRTGGKKISDAPHFPHSEALDFFEEHPRLYDAVQFIYDLEGGRGSEGGRISKRISPGYAAAMLYLAGMSTTDPAKYAVEGTDAMDDKLWERAEDFWTLFASGANLPEGSPILVLRELLVNIDAQSGAGRDDVVGATIKAMNMWFDDTKATTKATAVRLKKRKNDEGKYVIAEDEPRLGGIDFPVEDVVDLPAKPRATKKAPRKKPTKKAATKPKPAKKATAKPAAPKKRALKRRPRGKKAK